MENRIVTNNLILEICDTTRAPLVADFFNRNFEEFGRYEPLPEEARTVSLHKRSLEYEMEQFKKKKYLRAYIFPRNNPMLIIGTVSYRDIAYGSSKKATIGYKMDKDFRRLGYCTEAIITLNHLMFYNWGLNRIEATVLPDNFASIEMLEKMGFKFDGILRQLACINGKWLDHNLYSLIKQDYRPI